MAVERPYKVRKTWEDTKGQLSSYAHLENAIAKVNKNPEYSVFRDGECVYAVDKTDSVVLNDELECTDKTEETDTSEICHECNECVMCDDCTIIDQDDQESTVEEILVEADQLNEQEEEIVEDNISQEVSGQVDYSDYEVTEEPTETHKPWYRRFIDWLMKLFGRG